MVLWKVIIIVLGSIVAGILVGLALFYGFQQVQKKRLAFFRKKKNFTNSYAYKVPPTKVLSTGTAKKNGQKENSLETLVKNHKNNLVMENQKLSTKIESVNRIENINQKNLSVLREQIQSSKPGVPKALEILNQDDTKMIKKQPSASSVQDVVDYQSTLTKENQTKPSKPDAFKRPESNGRKDIHKTREQRRPSTPNISAEQKSTLTSAEQKKPSEQGISDKPEIDKQRIAETKEREKESPRSDFIKELEANLAIATTSWADKLLPFQTRCWDSKHGEGEPLLAGHSQELIQLYVDIGLANNIVWLSTEIGHRSKELDESYIKLCASIAERLKRVIPR